MKAGETDELLIGLLGDVYARIEGLYQILEEALKELKLLTASADEKIRHGWINSEIRGAETRTSITKSGRKKRRRSLPPPGTISRGRGTRNASTISTIKNKKQPSRKVCGTVFRRGVGDPRLFNYLEKCGGGAIF